METTNRKYKYPRRKGDGADVAYWLQQLAESTDIDIHNILTGLELEKPRHHVVIATAGWDTTGYITGTKEGAFRRVVLDLRFTRTGGDRVMSFTNQAWEPIGVVLPAAARASVPMIGSYFSAVLTNNGLNTQVQLWLNRQTGQLEMRHTANFTFPQGGIFYAQCTYYIPA